jgi:hypothetical protein
MRYGVRTLVAWVIVSTILIILTMRSMQQWQWALQWAFFYLATTAVPAWWTYLNLRVVRQLATTDARLRWRLEWMAWAPLIGGGMAMSSGLTLLTRSVDAVR